MSRVAFTVFAILGLLAASVLGDSNNDDCFSPMLEGNETASLIYFAGNLNISGTDYSIAPCGVSQTFPNCGNTTGYLAVYDQNGTCTVFDKKGVTTYNATAKQFTIAYIFGGTEIDIVVSCHVAADVIEGTRVGNVLNLRSDTVCVGYAPPTTTPSSGLSTGAIVGIVIGALAILVIVLVIFRWKAQKGEEDAEYQRV